MGTVSMRGLRDVQGPQCEMMGQKVPSGTFGPLQRHAESHSLLPQVGRALRVLSEGQSTLLWALSLQATLHSQPNALSCNTPATLLLSALNSPLVPSG